MSPKDQRQIEWTKRIAAYKASGLTMAAWCSANQITLEQFKYWIRKLKKVASSDVRTTTSNSFIPITVAETPASPTSPPLIIQIGSASISLQRGFDPKLLREAVEALSGSC